MKRCGWVPPEIPEYVAYHDEEWGVPVHDDRVLFEFLTLEGAQAGLSWLTILRKRDGYRRAFDDFDAAKVARYTPKRVEKLLADPGIVRNRLKVESTVNNAQRVLELDVPFSELLWSFVGGEPKVNRWKTTGEIPVETVESKAMSKELKRRGFRFVGPTVCYSLMQAVGLVNDHTAECFLSRPR
ncbi:MAG: DNA-3-methyladenine glycosylase I [Actinomycetota bacterium]